MAKSFAIILLLAATASAGVIQTFDDLDDGPLHGQAPGGVGVLSETWHAGPKATAKSNAVFLDGNRTETFSIVALEPLTVLTLDYHVAGDTSLAFRDTNGFGWWRFQSTFQDVEWHSISADFRGGDVLIWVDRQGPPMIGSIHQPIAGVNVMAFWSLGGGWIDDIRINQRAWFPVPSTGTMFAAGVVLIATRRRRHV